MARNDKNKTMLDPATQVTLLAAAWFVLKTAIQSIIGWAAAELASKFWARFKDARKGDDGGRTDPGVPKQKSH